MILNIAANMLGLANAATPFGIKAIQELDTLNEEKGTATNAMVLFLAINTSGLALLPTGVVGVRAANGSGDPWGIMAPTLAATFCSTVAGVLAAKGLCRLPFFARSAPPPPSMEAASRSEVMPSIADESPGAVRALSIFLAVGLGALVVPPIGAALLPAGDPLAESFRGFSATAGDWVIPVVITSLLVFGYSRGVAVYACFVEGAKEGFETAVRIIPYLVAILVAVGMFRASGAMGALTGWAGALTEPMGLPGEALPMAIVRPLSGSGAFALMSELVATHGPDSYIGYVASVLQGSTETTFYVLAVYFGAVGVTRARHAVAAGLTADIVGVLAATAICASLFGHLV
jgi:spore maturation protein SpmB